VEAEERYRLLVVDDNPAIHQDIRKILLGLGRLQHDHMLDDLEHAFFGDGSSSAAGQEAGLITPARYEFDIDSAYQGQQACEMAAKAHGSFDPYALAFVDVRMPPGWDGVRTIRELWRIDKQLQVIVCTAYSDHSWEDMIRQLGLSDRLLVLKKPFDPIEVLQVAYALARKWSLERQAKRRLDQLEADVLERSRALEERNRDLKRQIVAREQAEQTIRHVATHDSLTGLPNRILLTDRLEHAVKRAKRSKNRVAVLMLDIDHFKEVNDVWGHAAGDELLRQVAVRLSAELRGGDTVARMGGDEFVVILDDLDSAEMANQVAQRILERFAEAFSIDGHTHQVSPSIGISVYPSDSTTIETLLKTADMAMYHVKKSGRNDYCSYAEWMGSQAVLRAAVKNELSGVLERDELELWYQPLFGAEQGEMVAVEALVRWRHPERGLLEPLQFIPIAEESGQIVQIGRWVCDQAFAQQRRWIDAGLSAVPLSVNVSARQLQHDDLVGLLQELLAKYNLTSDHIAVELTESVFTSDLDRARLVLAQLRDKGIRAIIDDFGTGYASLNRLKTLPIYAVKIDRFFVQNIVDDQRDAAIVMAIITLAHSLGVKVIAEGIEAEDQLAQLRSLQWKRDTTISCDQVQGYLFCRPLPAAELTELRVRNGPAPRQAILGTHQG
jgi:diguanylate cyclase (GGDEF)-like protein